MATAKDTMHRIASLIETNFRPPGRATATAATFRQIGDIAAELELDPQDALAGFMILSRVREGDVPNVTARRKTCENVSDLIVWATHVFPLPPGNPIRLASVMECVVNAFRHSADPRQMTMAETARREADELTT